MTKTKAALVLPERSPEMLQKVVETLFPCHDTSPWAPVPYGQTGQSKVAPVMNDDLIAIAKSLKLNKASGSDGMLPVAIEASPDMFRLAMQMCLDRREFPERW